MPDLLRNNVLASYSIELTAALFAAAVALSFRRGFPRADLSSWGRGWIAGTVFAGLGIVGNGFVWPLGTFVTLRAIARGAGLLQAVWFLRGAYRLKRAEPPAWLTRAGYAAPVVGLLSSIVSTQTLPVVLDVLLRTFSSTTVGLASLAAAWLLLRAGERQLGNRLMAVGLVLYAMLKLFTPTTLGRLGLLEGTLAVPALYLGFSLGPITFALGLVVSLLEERQNALSRERDRLRVSEEMFGTLFRSSPDAILVTKPQSGGLIVAANAGFERLFGTTAFEAVGKTTIELGLWARPEDRAAAIRNRLQNGRLRDFEIDTLDKSGRHILVSVSAEDIEIGGESHNVAVVRDITAHREVQEALRRSERMAAVGAVVAGVAHEVRTPLFGISANLDALEVALGGVGRSREFIDVVRSQVARLSTLMSDLLDYGRPHSLTVVAGGLERAIAAAVRSCSSMAAEAGVTIESRIDALPADLETDSARLEQVFENLLSNAVHHSPPGGIVRITASATDGSRPSIVCVVEDQGPGIPEQHLTTVFVPFFSGRKGGTGLGLAIVQRIVEEHGGSVRAANRPTGGAIFTVVLPASTASSRREA